MIIVLPSSSDSRKPRAAPALTDGAPGGRQPWVWRERLLGGFPLPAGLRPLHPWGSPGCPQVTLPRATLNKGRKSVKLPGVAPSWPHTLEAACSALLPRACQPPGPAVTGEQRMPALATLPPVASHCALRCGLKVTRLTLNLILNCPQSFNCPPPSAAGLLRVWSLETCQNLQILSPRLRTTRSASLGVGPSRSVFGGVLQVILMNPQI